MVIFHFKHGYLNWKAIPYGRNMICGFSFFSTFFFLIEFRLDRIFQVHDMTINFLFLLFIRFFLFLNGLLWVTSHVIDGLPAWSISSQLKIVLKRLGFGLRLLVSFLSRKKIWLESIPEKWAISGQYALRHQLRWFQNVTILGLLFLVIEKVWQVWSCSKS